ncbi:hypothetical protein [Streptomyces sp. Midd1]|uniref:hypothetical protein n=1 Tax=Streptomyces sp. Midd3 TaxID=3161191 RepID=UPI0034DB17B5
MSLIDDAMAAFDKSLPEADLRAAREFDKTRREFIDQAQASADTTLGAAAAGLDWRYTRGSELPEETEEATAFLEAGRPEYLRYRYDHGRLLATFELVQPCLECKHVRINDVTDLCELGRLLATGGDA